MMAGLHSLKTPTKRIEEVIGLTGLITEAHKEIGQLSKGYKQRVGLAAALLHDPEVLILDEPTTGLDPNQIIEIREVIRSLSKDKTILFSTHILQEVEALCDRVIVINKGSIVADSRIEELRQSAAAAKLRVSFREKIEEETLGRVTGISHITKLNDHDWLLETADAEALSKELLGFTLQHNLNIVSLQTQTRRLEDIFRELTEANN
jgi:ABC-2 type transport system ATP-binding protein